MAPDRNLRIRFYTRTGCHLCKTAMAVVRQTLTRYPFGLEVLDVGTDSALEALYGEDIPVVEVDTPEGIRVFRHHVDPSEFEEEIEAQWNR